MDPDCRKWHLGSLDGLPDEGYHTLHVLLYTDAENWYTGGETVATAWSHSLAHAEESVEKKTCLTKHRDKVQEAHLYISFMVTYYWWHVNSNVRGKQRRMTRVI